MASEHEHVEPSDTGSFSVPEAVRAPVGTTVADDHARLVRRAAVRMLVGLTLIIVDVRLETGFDHVPDTIGGVVIVAGALPVAALARRVGPSRAGGRVLLLALVHLLLVWPNDLDAARLAELGLSSAEATWEAFTAAQTVVGLLGTAITATVLARAHDALDQLGRRDRWARTRRWALALVGLWLPLSLLVALGGADPEAGGVVGGLTAAGSLLTLVVGLWVLVLLARALAGSLAVVADVGHRGH